MRKTTRIVSFVLAVMMMGSAFAGCSSTPATSTPASKADASSTAAAKTLTGETGKTYDLTLWGSGDDQAMLKKQVESFKKADPTNTYNIKVGVFGEDKVKEEVLKDASAAADVFSFAHDQLGALVAAGAVYENTKYADRIASEDLDAAIAAAKGTDGKVYGYPTAMDGYAFVYNKKLLGDADITSFDKVLAKSQDAGVTKIGIDSGNAYFTGMFFLSAGCKLFGDNGTDAKTVTFNDANGLAATKYLATLKAKGVASVNDDQMVSLFKSKKLASQIAGNWKCKAIKDVLGDDMGIAAIPSLTIDGKDAKTVGFVGVKMYAVNAKTKAPAAAMALADFLSNKDNQLVRYTERGYLPANKALSTDATITADPVSKGLLAQYAQDIVTPSISAMNNFWTPTGAFTKDAFDGKIKDADMQKKLDALNSDIINGAKK